MDYVVSARKYRPATFDSVVGQKAITTTLRGAILNHQLAQAYLFCGPRGVGKTTCARIFAKTINCQNLQADGTPCDACESCRAFNENRSLNIHELDAASNNSVDNIRELVDQVRILPQVGRYSVYIIDEVHMLSTAAFNAFLKTLEEPPAHAVFILATTEKHKIIPTILSRCQIYDFHRIRVEDTVEYLKTIAQAEGVTAEEEALNVIAQKADGAMRDALSIFDQVVNFTNKHITYAAVIENLNVLDYDYYFRLTEHAYAGQTTDVLLILNEILERGFNGGSFIAGFSAHLRNLLVSKDAVTLPLLEVTASIRDRYAAQAKAIPVAYLFEALTVLEQAEVRYRQVVEKRFSIELALLKLCQLGEKKKSSLTDPDTLPVSITSAPVTDTKAPVAATPAPKPTEPTTKKVEAVKPVVETAKVEEVKPAPAMTEVKSHKSATVSIKASLSGISHAATKVAAPEKKEEPLVEKPFDMILLKEALAEFLASTEDKSLSVAINTFEPKIEGNKIVFYTELLQQKYLMSQKDMITDYLKKALQNDALHIQIEVPQEEEKVVRVKHERLCFSDSDRLAYYKELNPNLERLCEALKLIVQ